ncbi:MAG TPA: phosphoglycerate mutase family protein [Chitinophagaceae bacterium]|nr:phosphoglycerate mutase family protein [Chitinophagaceae bacterium]
MNRHLLVILIFGACVSSCSQRIYVVRHAEKLEDRQPGPSTMMRTDPELSEAGRVRALNLRDLLESRHIRYIFSTGYRRTEATVRPLSEYVGIPITYYRNDSLQDFIDRIRSIRRGNVLIVGHSNTVDDIINGICQTRQIASDLPESEYDRLFVIKRKGKRTHFSESRYGYPSNP